MTTSKIARLKQIKDQVIVGLEYLIKIKTGEDFEPFFYCALCENIRIDFTTVMCHLTAFNHRLKYLEKHFPTAFKEISNLEGDKREHKIRLTEKVCQSIEDNYGRQSVIVVEKNDFLKNPTKYIDAALYTTHFDEYMDCSFVGCTLNHNVIDKGDRLSSEFLNLKDENLGRRTILESISSSSESDASDNAIVINSSSSCGSNSSSNSNSSSKLSLHTTSPSTSRWIQSTSPIQVPRNPEQIQNQTYKMETLLLEMEEAKGILSKKYEKYLRTPMSHPEYLIEWKIFLKRYRELHDEKEDSNYSNYKQNWINEWKKILDLKLKKEIEEKEFEIREKFGPILFTLESTTSESIVVKSLRELSSAETHVKNSNSLSPKSLESHGRVSLTIPHKGLRTKTSRSPERHRRSRSPQRLKSPKKYRRSRSPQRFQSPKRYRRTRSPQGFCSPKRYRRSRTPQRFRSPKRYRRSRSRSPKRFRSPNRQRKSRSRSRSKRLRSPKRHRKSRSRTPQRFRSTKRYRKSRSISPRRFRSPKRSPTPKKSVCCRSTRSSNGSILPEKLSTITESHNNNAHLRFEQLLSQSGYSYESSFSFPTLPVYEPVRAPSIFSFAKETSLSESAQSKIDDLQVSTPNSQPLPQAETIIPNKDTDQVDEPITIISVLSLLTALEDLLGSLGLKVIELMTKAIVMEKHKINSSNQLLDNIDDFVMFQIMKEKLKGMLSANLVEAGKTNVVKKVIKNMDFLVNEAKEKQKFCIVSSSQGTKEYDRVAIAAKLRLALIKQGQTDVSKIDLEQLTDAYINMANDKKNSVNDDEIGSTAAVVEQQETIEIMSVSSADVVDTDASELVEQLVSNNSVITPPITLSVISPSSVQSSRMEIISMNSTSSSSDGEYDDYSITRLSNSQLKTLINKFEFLSGMQKKHVLQYLKKLQKEEPERIKRLIDINDLSKVYFGLPMV